MLRDEASAFLAAGGRIESADMVLRMLRVALPRRPGAVEHRRRRGQALALLQAVGGFQAYRRAVPAPPNALPGRALPALRAHLSRLGRRLGRRRAQRARSAPTATRATPSRSCACSA